MVADDAAMDEVNTWISTNQIPRTDTNAIAGLNRKIRARLDEVTQSYQDFLRNHPDSAHGFLAYGSFLNDIGEEEKARAQYENSRLLDPKNPAVWNQLANYYGEWGGLTNAFAYYAEAIRLDPTEPVYIRISPRLCIFSAKTPANITASLSSRFLTKRLVFISRR